MESIYFYVILLNVKQKLRQTPKKTPKLKKKKKLYVIKNIFYKPYKN